jgi:hypothetical protein
MRALRSTFVSHFDNHYTVNAFCEPTQAPLCVLACHAYFKNPIRPWRRRCAQAFGFHVKSGKFQYEVRMPFFVEG